MSIQKPGRNSVKAISNNANVSHRRLRVKNQPCVAAAKANMAITATTNTNRACQTLVTPISKRSVLKMKRNGRMAVRMS